MEPQEACRAATLLFVLTIISVGLYGGSFDTLGPLEAGLQINSVTNSVAGSKIFTSGRYFLGLANKFIVYPTTLQTIAFSSREGSDDGPLSVSTSDGTSITIEVSFQFRLQVSNLLPLYRKYVQNYKSNYVAQAATAIKTIVAPKFAISDYFTRREDIAIYVHGLLNQKMSQQFCVVEQFQLGEIRIPVTSGTSTNVGIDGTILKNLIKQQTLATTLVIQQSTLVRGRTGIIVAGANAQVNVINANAASTATKIVETANAQVIEISQNATVKAFKYLRQTLNYTNSQLLQHFLLSTVQALPDSAELSVDVANALVSY